MASYPSRRLCYLNTAFPISACFSPLLHTSPLSQIVLSFYHFETHLSLKLSWFDGALKICQALGQKRPWPRPLTTPWGGGKLALSNPKSLGQPSATPPAFNPLCRNPQFLQPPKSREHAGAPYVLQPQTGSPVGLRAGIDPASHPTPVWVMGADPGLLLHNTQKSTAIAHFSVQRRENKPRSKAAR